MDNRGLPPETSNFCCLPGRAGGTPGGISRTKPLVRLILNQIGRRLTEDLNAKGKRHRLLLMLDEFPALGRLDFFESALAFMAGYGLKAFLIAQSLNQIEKAYGQSNSILDNCHVRVSFASNDERTAKRVSDALGTATEIRDAKNYAGHRLSPWLGHLMVSRQETARPLLAPRRRAITRIISYRRESCRRLRPWAEHSWTATPTSQSRRPKMIGRVPSSRLQRPIPKIQPTQAFAESRNCPNTRTSPPRQKSPPRSSTSPMTKPTTADSNVSRPPIPI